MNACLSLMLYNFRQLNPKLMMSLCPSFDFWPTMCLSLMYVPLRDYKKIDEKIFESTSVGVERKKLNDLPYLVVKHNYSPR